MAATWFERILKQVLLIIAVLLITSAIALADVNRYQAVRLRELVVIDPKVFYHEKILDKLPRDARVVFLSGDTPGLEQLTKILAREKDIRVLRLFTHGSPGRVALNGEVLDRKYLTRRREVFRSWARAFAPDADILLYGCSVAQEEVGEAFVDELARLTGADVAASTNRTGGVENEWALEYQTGPVEASAVNITGYPFYLANQVVTSNLDNGGGDETTLREAVAAVGDGEEITFNITSFTGDQDTVTISSELAISGKSITIDGYNNATGSDVIVQVMVPGTSTYRVFKIGDPSAATVTIENMTIKGGNISGNGDTASGYGGGIYIAAGTLVLDDSTVSSSVAASGGGIYNAGSAAIITNSTITGNEARNNPDESKGGGLYGAFDVSNSTISGNRALKNIGDHNRYTKGGGLFINGNSKISNCTISGNTAESIGTDSYYAKSYGGGIYNDGVTVDIVNSTISGNTAESSDGSSNDAYGGGIYNSDGSVRMLNSVIVSNTVTGSTSAVGPDIKGDVNGYYCWSGDVISSGNGNNQGGSTLGVEGSASYHGGFTETVSIDAGTSTNAANGAFAYYNDTDEYYYNSGTEEAPVYKKISNGSTITPSSPSADKIITDQRGYYRNTSESRTVTRGAYQYDGVVAKIYITTSWTGGTIGTDVFTTIQAAVDNYPEIPLGIYLAETAIFESGINIDKDVTIQGAGVTSTYVQAAASAGTASNRVFNITAGTATLEDMTIRYGNIAGNGGGIYNSAELTINNSTISGNTSDENNWGGGIYNGELGTVNINSSYLSGNAAFYCGGIFNYGELNIVDSTISGNTADYWGGGIYTYAVMTLENSTVSGNTCTGASGGGIYMTGGTSELTNSTISGNRSDNHGGGIYTSGGGGTLIVSNCTIANNHSDEDNSEGGEGGGIYFSNTTLTASNTILANNYKGSGTGTGDDYYYATGTLIDNGYNVVEYQNFPSLTLSGPKKAFYLASDILYNTQFGDSSKTDFETWTQHTSPTSIETLNLSSALALNDSTNGTYTLAFTGDSFAAASATTGIPSTDTWNNSPAADQRGIARTADQNTSIGAYSANYLVALYYYKSDADGGDWHVSSGDYTWTRCLTEDGTYENTYETPTTANSNSVTIFGDAIVTITLSDEVTMDHLTVDDGAGLVLNTGGSLEITDGSEAADFTVNGTLDMDGGSFTLTSGALAYGAASTLIYSDSAASQTTGGELKTTGMGNVTFNNLDGVSVSGATAVNGTLTISTGTLLTTSSNITASGQTSGTGTVNASAGTFTYNRSGDQTLFSGTYYNLTHSEGGTKTLTGNVAVNHDLTIDGGATLDVNCSDPLTVQNNLTVTNGTIDLSDFDGNLKLGGNLVIENNGRWSKQSNSTKYIQFYGSSCTFTDNSSGGPQNLGHVKVDE